MTHPTILAILLIAGPASGLHGQSGSNGTTGPMPVIELEHMQLVDTVRIDSLNTSRYYIFNLKNTGDAPLVIDRVASSDPCYCSHWPQEPVLPAGTAQLKVACPPLQGPGQRTQHFSIQSNAAEPVIFDLKRIGVPSLP